MNKKLNVILFIVIYLLNISLINIIFFMIEYKCQAHNKFRFRCFESLVTFDSEFDSGNCHKVEKINNN